MVEVAIRVGLGRGRQPTVRSDSSERGLPSPRKQFRPRWRALSTSGWVDVQHYGRPSLGRSLAGHLRTTPCSPRHGASNSMGIQTPLPLLEGRALSYGTDLELLPRAVAELLTSSTSNRRAACLPELRSTGTLQPRLSKSTTVLLLGLERRDVRTVECCRSSQP